MVLFVNGIDEVSFILDGKVISNVFYISFNILGKLNFSIYYFYC